MGSLEETLLLVASVWRLEGFKASRPGRPGTGRRCMGSNQLTSVLG